MLWTIALTLSLAAPPTVNVSVEGNGYLQFAQEGHALYTSSAPLTVVDGWLSDPDGAPLIPTLRVPEGTIRVDVDAEGNVFAATRYYRARVGQISLAVFNSTSDLRPMGSFLVSSERPKLETPGRDEAGTIHILRSGESAPPTVVPPTEPVAIQPQPSPNDAFVMDWVHHPLHARHQDAKPTVIPAGHAEIRVSSLSDTPKERFTLGDIALIDAPADLKQALWKADLGSTPVIGKKLALRRGDILNSLAKLGFDTNSIDLELPARATLQRTSQRVTQEEISSVALEAAAEYFGQHAGLKAKVPMEDERAPTGTLSFTAESCVPTKDGASVIVVTKINGQRYTSHVVKVTADRAVLQRRSNEPRASQIGR